MALKAADQKSESFAKDVLSENGTRSKVRCASNSRGWHRGKGLWKKEDGSPFQSEQIGFVLTDKNNATAERCKRAQLR